MTTYYRVSWVAPDWRTLEPHESGHPLYIPLNRQGAGRFDLPHLYYALYISRAPQGAVGEILGDLKEWPEALWAQTLINDAGIELQRHLVTMETDRSFIDLDDGAKLDKLGWKPSRRMSQPEARVLIHNSCQLLVAAAPPRPNRGSRNGGSRLRDPAHVADNCDTRMYPQSCWSIQATLTTEKRDKMKMFLRAISALALVLTMTVASQGALISPAAAGSCYSTTMTVNSKPGGRSSCSGYSSGTVNRLKMSCGAYMTYGPWKSASSSSAFQWSMRDCSGLSVSWTSSQLS